MEDGNSTVDNILFQKQKFVDNIFDPVNKQNYVVNSHKI